jgi:two-component system, chemotaxis family, CheB/CheR fusion protein
MLGRSYQQESVISDGKTMGSRVLVVDDCSDTAHVCAKLLRLSGFEVAVALGGFEALRLASEFHPRVILLDFGLPDIDGFEVARRLRADAKFKEMTLIAFTAFASDKARARANEGDFDHFLVKPMPFADLLKLLVEVTVTRPDLAQFPTGRPDD